MKYDQAMGALFVAMKALKKCRVEQDIRLEKENEQKKLASITEVGTLKLKIYILK